MVVFKCKMCGGEMSLEEGATVAECPYCMTKQTLPRLDNDKRANMYDRANHFRRQNEYDKAMAIFENILQEDRTDAEAYWSLVLCRYGIEYVEDPATHKRVPTVNRVQYTSILADEDYKSALEYADFAQRSVYEEEAKAIDEIQKGILAISKQEKPFDVFICYKETDANGRRTPDSVLANDLYHQLTNEGFKVFFSRITLEDKIGTAYEPYIFAALNSAKVMVVLGTKPEYFNAVWVKNEWSRYLALIRAGADKTLVPAYRDMDPYDLPEEFSHLQAQDMGKLGFMQDLIRGIKKLTTKETAKPQTTQSPTVASPSGATVDSLMKRARLFLEDKDFDNANDYLNKVLDINPEYAPAYIGKVMVALKVSSETDLKSSFVLYEKSSDWQKAIRFSTPEQKKTYESYLQAAIDLREEVRKDGIYTNAVSSLKRATTREQCEQAAREFRSIRGYRDSSEQEEAAEIKGKTLVYDEGIRILKNARTVQECSKAKSLFNTIREFRDSRSQVEACDQKIEAINNGIYRSAVDTLDRATQAEECDRVAATFRSISNYRDSREKAQIADQKARQIREQIQREAKERADAEARRKEAEIKREKTKKTILVLSAICAITLIIVYFTVIKPLTTYNGAVAKISSKEYYEAFTTFSSLGEYKDSSNRLQEVKQIAYNDAVSEMNNQNYPRAFELFMISMGYSDSHEKCDDIVSKMTNAQRKDAITISIKYAGDTFFANNASDYTSIWQNALGEYLVGTYTTTDHQVIKHDSYYGNSIIQTGPSTVVVSYEDGVLKFYCETGFDNDYSPYKDYEIKVSSLSATSASSISGDLRRGSYGSNYSMHGSINIDLKPSISMRATKGLSSFNGDESNFSLKMSR